MREMGENGDHPHWHAIIIFADKKKNRSRDTRWFDIGSLHPNIKV